MPLDPTFTTIDSRGPPARRRSPLPPVRRRAGLTLVEVMLGMVVIGTACFAALSGMLMTLRIADSNLLSLSASSAARSVAEQLLAVDYTSLFNTHLPVDVPSHPGGSLVADTWNIRTDDFNRTPANPHDDLQLRINPNVTRIRESGGLDYAQVVIAYEWRDSTFFVPRTRSDTYTMLVAPVPAF